MDRPKFLRPGTPNSEGEATVHYQLVYARARDEGGPIEDTGDIRTKGGKGAAGESRHAGTGGRCTRMVDGAAGAAGTDTDHVS